jgi:acylphosphatase
LGKVPAVMQTSTIDPRATSFPSALPPTGPASRRTVYFSGRVQGVGFRYTARNVALQYDVTGYVRNLADGRVELVMEGSDAEMDRVVETISRKMSGFVRGVTSQRAPTTGEFDQFVIKH